MVSLFRLPSKYWHFSIGGLAATIMYLLWYVFAPYETLGWMFVLLYAFMIPTVIKEGRKLTLSAKQEENKDALLAVRAALIMFFTVVIVITFHCLYYLIFK